MLAARGVDVLHPEREARSALRVEDSRAGSTLGSGVTRSVWSLAAWWRGWLPSAWTGIERSPVRQDLASAVTLLVCGVVAVVFLNPEPSPGPFSMRWADADVRALGSTLLLIVAVALRRRLPVAAVFATILGYVLLGDAHLDSLLLVAVLALWTALAGVVAYSRWPTVGFAVAACVPTVFLGELVAGDTASAGDGLMLAIPIGIGLLTRAALHRRRARGVRAHRRSWDQERAAVLRERVRIARELHDVAAHHMSAIVVSAGAALRVLDREPAGARETLAEIAGSARRTGEAMERLLGTMAEAGAGEVTDGLPTRPGLGDLRELVDHFERIGCRARLRVDGDLGAVPPDAALSAFRIVQEGLTNALKHGGPDAVEVGVSRSAAGLAVSVQDPGPAGPASAPVQGSGQGLIGMAERVALFGGTLACGPAPAGGWAVYASIPLA